MSLGVVLDAGPVGLLCHRKGVAQADKCKLWFREQLHRGTSFYLPEVVDYEVRRELLRLNKAASIRRLDNLQDTAEDTFLPITTVAMRRAAELWAESRRSGHPTADPKELDADVILCAQVLTTEFHVTEIIVATTNVGHLSRFLNAAQWDEV